MAFGLFLSLLALSHGGVRADPPIAPNQADASLVVSLTFDDGRASQRNAVDALADAGLSATFYVNSGFPDTAGYMTWEEIEELEQAGHEIGGHTVSHARLPTLDAGEQLREVCSDRTALLRRGLAVRSFAYPFSDVSPEGPGTAADCGYNSARIVGNTYDREGCANCSVSESLPPTDLFRLKTVAQVNSETTLADLQRPIRDALAAGDGGWFPYVFHDVCEDCSTLALSPDTFRQFVDWLASQLASGVAVRTIGDVVGGPVQPEVAGPAPAARPGGLVVNPSMEQVQARGEGAPALEPEEASSRCWVRASIGDSGATWTRPKGGHSGSYAERIDIVSATAGRTSVLIRQDLGDCSLPASGGDALELRAWYRADVRVRFVAWWRSDGGAWHYWKESPSFTPSSDWREQEWTTLALPTEAVGISVGLAIDEVGYLIVDDVTAQFTDPSTNWVKRGPVLIVGFVAALGALDWAVRAGRSARRRGKTLA